MSRFVSTFAAALLLFLALFTTFTSAAPTDVVRGELEVQRRNGNVPPVNPPVNTYTNCTNSTNPPNPNNSTNPPDFNNSTITTNTTVPSSTTNNTVVDDAVSSSYGGTNGGRATWYETGLGACGQTNTDSDFIVALSEADWAGGSNCGKQLRITDSKNGKSSTATVRDLCPGCSSGDLDMSPALFTSLDGNLDDGVFQMTWYYL